VKIDVELRALAQLQHGVVSRSQARELGAKRHHLRRRLESPDWQAMTPRVLLLVGVPRTFRQRCMAATLDAGNGAAVSHESAAALWGLPGFGAGAVDITRAVGLDAHPSPLAALHRTCCLPPTHVRLFQHIPVTSPARTIFDLAGTLHPQRAERALDNALGRRLTTVPALRQVTEELARQGRPGSALMRRLLADRADSYRAPESNLEARFESILEDAGVPVPLRQQDVGGAEWIGRVDYLDPDRKVVVEIDSELHHTSLLDAASDAERDAALAEAGYTVVRMKEHDLWHRPEEVVRRFVAP
jgi:very-short-patch-repair endonuclease